MNKIRLIHLIAFVFLLSCDSGGDKASSAITEAQAIAMTKSRPVQKQWKGTFAFEDQGVYFSNEFDGARLNGVMPTGEDQYHVLIVAENYPINQSPWYAFKVWSREPKEITIRLTYQGSRNRYYPKVSKDGMRWTSLDSANYTPIGPGSAGGSAIEAAPEAIEMVVDIDSSATWVAAQEVFNSTRVFEWMDSLAAGEDISVSTIGKSREGRDMKLLTIGDETPQKAVMIISRQHPPEVTGFLAMKAFIEAISDTTALARAFRSGYATYVVPLMNPDGVDHGHWRHNMAGVDLNRDWTGFNQPETQAVKTFTLNKIGEGVDFVYGMDFHSTWYDVYYPTDSSLTDQHLELAYDVIEKMDEYLPGYVPNVEPSQTLHPNIYSRNFFLNDLDMSAMIFEFGDTTDRTFINEKGKVAARALMELLLEE